MPIDVSRELVCLLERVDELVRINVATEQRNRELVETLRFEHYHVNQRIAKLDDNLVRLITKLTRFNQNQAERATLTNFMAGPAIQVVFDRLRILIGCYFYFSCPLFYHSCTRILINELSFSIFLDQHT